jgi:hypothetical protein
MISNKGSNSTGAGKLGFWLQKDGAVRCGMAETGELQRLILVVVRTISPGGRPFI